MRPFFCQVEAVEAAIWLTEVAPQIGKVGQTFIEHLASANNDANPELMRLALKLATGAGKTTWQTINAVRRPNSKTTRSGSCCMWRARGARDHLLVTSIEPGSEFLEDLRPPGSLNG